MCIRDSFNSLSTVFPVFSHQSVQSRNNIYVPCGLESDIQMCIRDRPPPQEKQGEKIVVVGSMNMDITIEAVSYTHLISLLAVAVAVIATRSGQSYRKLKTLKQIA